VSGRNLTDAVTLFVHKAPVLDAEGNPVPGQYTYPVTGRQHPGPKISLGLGYTL
jgi:hypothetical protein